MSELKKNNPITSSTNSFPSRSKSNQRCSSKNKILRNLKVKLQLEIKENEMQNVEEAVMSFRDPSTKNLLKQVISDFKEDVAEVMKVPEEDNISIKDNADQNTGSRFMKKQLLAKILLMQ